MVKKKNPHQNIKQKQYCNKFNEDFKNNLKTKQNKTTNIIVPKKEIKI